MYNYQFKPAGRATDEELLSFITACRNASGRPGAASGDINDFRQDVRRLETAFSKLHLLGVPSVEGKLIGRVSLAGCDYSQLTTPAGEYVLSYWENWMDGFIGRRLRLPPANHAAAETGSRV
jgi:hypothetical protein